MRPSVMLVVCLAFAIPATSAAFCGLYVTEPGQTIENQGSAVIYANHDGTTTLTIAADFEGDAASFGLLVPIPAAIGEDDVRVVDPVLFDYLDTYTTPRLVTLNPYDGDADTDADSDADADADADRDEADPVVVEDRFTVGGYDVAVLATSDADALSAWLDAAGFAAPEDRGGILQDYIDQGRHFLAAKVAVDEVVTGVAWLPPLQFSYAGRLSGLPIRIGTLSASGPQELVVYAITDIEDGQVRITNYPEAHVPDECLWQGTDLDAWYGTQLDVAFGGHAGWLREYAIPVIGRAACDPCTTNAPLFVSDLPQYGWDGDLADTGGGLIGGAAYLTRLRVRYSAAEAYADLDFAGAGDLPLDQIRYIAWNSELEGQYPLCDDVPVDPLTGEGVHVGAAGCGGCAQGTPARGAFALAAAFGSIRRIRRRRR
jgi:hypothetical protein